MSWTVLIVDDHEAFRAAARRMLESAGFVVVAEAGDATGALDAVATAAPDVVLLDVQLPDTDGIDVAEQLARRPTPPLVVFISSREAVTYGERLARAPARGFIAKADLTGPALAAMVG
jgi:DNA-binding NarL/FixJ family response regulator